MAEFTPEIASDIVSACREGCPQAAEAFRRAFDDRFSVVAGELRTISRDSLPDTWNGPGLVIAFHIGVSGALLLLPEASNLLPDWYTEPDEAGQRKLAALAQELGTCLVPACLSLDETSAARVKDLASSFLRAEPAGDIGCLPLALTRGNLSGEAALVWPVRSASRAADGTATDDGSTPDPHPSLETPAAPRPPRPSGVRDIDIDEGLRRLPRYARSLLKVRVPVTVTLASAKYRLSQILELGPGSIIQFNKSCEDNLTLEVGERSIARGEAVKVGDKFGLWISSMTMPDERFWVIHGRRGGTRVK